MDRCQTVRIRTFNIKRRRKKTVAYASRIMLVKPCVFLFVLLTIVPYARAQCFGGIETYEKTPGMAFASVSNLQGLVSQPGTAVTRDCAALCRQTATCAAFTVDYTTSRCQSIGTDDIKRREHLRDAPGVNYFEKVCLRRVNNFSTLCGDRQWAFERVLGAVLLGFDDVEHTNVPSRTDCQRLCLEHGAFMCRSAEYDESAQICRLSREDRRTQPMSFRRDGGTWDYLENQCVRTLPDCRYAVRPEGSLAVSMDQVEFAQSQGECESLCDQARVFTCRAYSFTADENRCYLSGDDSVSQPVVPSVDGSIIPSTGTKKTTVYAEKICSVSQCDNGMFTFEKVTGHFLRSARQEILSRSRPIPASRMIGPGDSPNGGIGVECGKSCVDMGADCPAFSIDYAQGRCFKLDRNSQGRAQELTIREGMSYFEKICLRGNVGPCRDRAWAFERHPSKELRGMDERTLPLVATRRDCEEACLRESRFVCRSARYDTKALDCKLSSSDKRLRPEAFVDAPSHVEYLENQCIGLGNGMCSYETVPDMYPRYLDAQISNVTDDDQCQRLCSNHRPFACRGYSFYGSGNQCLISSDDRISAGSSALMSRPGTNYTERSCAKRSAVEPSHNESNNSPSASGLVGDAGPLGPNDAMSKPESGPEVSSFTTLRFPSTPIHNFGSSFAPFNAFGSDAMDRLPSKNGPPVRNQHSSVKCRSGRPHYQKVTGFEAVTSKFVILRPADARVIERTGVLIDCLDKCGVDEHCDGINYNGIKHICVGIESDANVPEPGGHFIKLPTPRNNETESFLLRPNAAVGYFESLCLEAPACDVAWSSERAPGFFMRGAERETIRAISRIKCTEKCLDERRFVCRSASYDTHKRECHLSEEDRYTRPKAFQSNPIFDYIENQCASTESRQCRHGPVQPDRYLLYADRMISGASQTAATCQAACDSERHFRCRSFSVHAVVPSTPMQCSLSSSISPTYETQRGAKAVERDCTNSIANEIPVHETAHLGVGGNRDDRIMPGIASGNIPAADPGGWVSLASLSRAQARSKQGNQAPSGGALTTHDYNPRVMNRFPDGRPFTEGRPLPPGRPFADSRPSLDGRPFPESRPSQDGRPFPESRPSQDGRPFPDSRPPQEGRPYPPDGNRRPADVTSFDFGFQQNTVSLPQRPFHTTTDNFSPVPTNPAVETIVRCRGAITYDKVVNADYVGARRQEIRLSGEGSPTIECLHECDRLRERCMSVVMVADRFTPDSDRNASNLPRLRCYILDRSAAMDNSPLPFTPDSMYYEKVCLADSSCGKAWTFVRVHGYELEGFDHQVTRNVMSKEECQTACLRMPNAMCRSAEFVPREKICRMSSDNRRTQLRSFRATSSDTIYMENQCAGDPPHCEYQDQTGRIMMWYDRAAPMESQPNPAAALSECRRLCDAERDFLCKSVTVTQVRRSSICLLSADDTVSFTGVPGANAPLVPERDSTYSERASCSNVRVECTRTDMLVTLAFGYPFNGRVYVNGNYESCFEVGNGQRQMVMRLPLVGSCGTVQQVKGRYVNNIIVQHNPLIMQDSDSSVRVECVFEASEQTISYSPPGGRRDGSGAPGVPGGPPGSGGPDFMGPGSIDVTSPVRQLGHSVVTNTAPTPALRMRILSRNGQESRIVGLGELLTLRIDVDPTSAFGIMARNVEARTDTGEVMILIDATGCPKDSNIFPPMELDANTKSLFADFKAFRFPTSATVNFVATIAFCQERCEPVRCPEGWESFGRRKRDAPDATTEPISVEHTTFIEMAETTEAALTTVDPSEKVTTTETATTDGAPSTEVAESEAATITPTSDLDPATGQTILTTERSTPRRPTNIIPVEVPLTFQLIVAPEADRLDVERSPAPASSQTGALYHDPAVRAPPKWRSAPLTQDRLLPQTIDEGAGCSAKSPVAVVCSLAVLLQLGTVAAFYVFYRKKRTSWKKASDAGPDGAHAGEPFYGLRHSGSVSEVTFRNVYGQKSGPGSLTRAFHLNMSPNPRGPHVASVFSAPDP